MTRKQLQLFDDHHAMLADAVRMDAWASAIERTVRPGDRVVDLGAGTGILGMLALRAGAAHVDVIEKTDSIELAKRIAAHNGLADRMTFHHASSVDVELEQRADVLVSETLGSFGVEENTLQFTRDARERLLRPDGRMLPQGLRLWLAPVDLPAARERLRFWQDVRGLDFGPAADEELGRMAPHDVRAEHLTAAPQVFAEVDLRAHTADTLESTLRFGILRPGTLHGVAGWFQVVVCPGVVLSTAPNAPPTHWRQAVFPLREAVPVVAGDVFEVTLRIGPKGPRSDDTAVSVRWRCTQRAR